MLKTMLYDLNKVFNKGDMKTIVVHNSDGKMRISCHTDDKQLYAFGESINDSWNEKEFAFRDWSCVSAILSSFYDNTEPEKCSMTLEKNDEDYPNVLKVKSGRTKMTHYLQNYTFISRQEDLLNMYKGKKFTLKPLTNNYLIDFDSSSMSKISKLSGISGEKTFRIGLENGDLYFYFGDETKTIDNAKICVCESYSNQIMDKGLSFSVEYMNIAYNALRDCENINIKVDSGMIVLSGENEVSKKVMAVVGKKEI